jgi:hypothetical protein
VCVTVNCKVSGNSGSAVLPVVPSCVNKVSINPIIQSKTPSIVTPTRDSIHMLHRSSLGRYLYWFVGKKRQTRRVQCDFCASNLKFSNRGHVKVTFRS